MASFNARLLVIAIALSGPLLAAAAGRGLRAPPREWHADDPSGYNAFAAARVFKQGDAPKFPRKGLTPEDAESLVNPTFNGIYRATLDPKHSNVAMATVEADPVSMNPDRKKMLTRPQGRAAIDLPSRPIDVQSGQPQVPTLAMGSAALAQTWEGATAVSASDSVLTNVRGKRGGTTTARNMVTSNATPLPSRANRIGSFAAGTSEPVKSMALSGAADGVIALAQADHAVAMSTAGKSRADSWQTAEPPSWRRPQ